MKTSKLYEIRVFIGNRYSRSLSPKLRERTRATKLKNYLKKTLWNGSFYKRPKHC